MGGCSVSQISSGVTGVRAAVKACIACHVGRYAVRPSARIVTVIGDGGALHSPAAATSTRRFAMPAP